MEHNIGEYIIGEHEKKVLELIDKHGAIGFIRRESYYNYNFIYSKNFSDNDDFEEHYNFFSYCFNNNFWYSIYHIMNNYKDITNHYLDYEKDNIVDIINFRDSRYYSIGLKKPMIFNITEKLFEILKTKDTTNLHILLLVLNVLLNLNKHNLKRNIVCDLLFILMCYNSNLVPKLNNIIEKLLKIQYEEFFGLTIYSENYIK